MAVWDAQALTLLHSRHIAARAVKATWLGFARSTFQPAQINFLLEPFQLLVS